MATTGEAGFDNPPVGFVNPNVPPLTEKENTFHTKPQQHDQSTRLSDATEKDAPTKEGTYEVNEVDSDVDHTELFSQDPFKPFDNMIEEPKRIITIRAVFVGLICGALVNASNIYLGLKTGWTFGANLFGAIVGFAVLKPVSKALPAAFPILGGDFGPRENNIVQTAAMASGGLSNVFVSAILAIYQLNLMGDNVAGDYWKIVSITVVGGYFGFFFATPLRKFFIIYVARELKLVFPTPSAVALSIRSMHEAVNGEMIGKMKMKALSASFVAAVLLRVVSQYATGILWDWHIFTWFYIWGGYNNSALVAENWGWIIEWTPAFIGSGMLVGLNVAFSFFGGSVLAWGIIGPALVHNNMAFGIKCDPTEEVCDPKWEPVTNFYSLSTKWSNRDTPSPRFWLLWPGVLGMIAVSFLELFLQWKVFYFAGKAIWRGTCKGLTDVGTRMGKDMGFFARQGQQKEEDMVVDPTRPEDRVRVWMWATGLIGSIIFICVVMGEEFTMPVGMTLLAVFLAFFFSFLAVQCAGVTDITPLTAASKASQIVLGGATKGEHWDTTRALRLNLLGGAIANIGANQASDLTADFRTGFLLRTPPIQQWIAQGVGTIVAVFLAPAMFVLFAKAYPCVTDLDQADNCPFSLPSVSAWRATAVAVVDPTFPVPTSSGIFAIVFAIFGCIMVMIRHFVWVGKLEWVRAYHPNMMCIYLAFVINQTVYGTAMVIGAIPAYIWAKKNPKSFDILGYAVAAGLIAGEGIGGVINALFQIVGISGPEPYGTNIACPSDAC